MCRGCRFKTSGTPFIYGSCDFSHEPSSRVFDFLLPGAPDHARFILELVAASLLFNREHSA